MKSIITDFKVFSIAFVGLVGGTIWGFMSHWEPEPIILIAISIIEIIAFSILKGTTEESNNIQTLAESINHGNVSINVNVGENSNTTKVNEFIEKTENLTNDREAKIDFMKSKTKILFIDDDKNFNVVKILKDSGWRHTKSVIDVKSIDLQIVKDSHIYFVDINGVGKLLSLEHEGLDLALMIKQKYPNKKIIIYSANRKTNAFHEAWDTCDFKLEKNALPNQFQNIVEQYSIELYNNFR